MCLLIALLESKQYSLFFYTNQADYNELEKVVWERRCCSAI